MSWLERIFRRQHLYDELGEEVHAHLEEKTEQLMCLENLPRAEARQSGPSRLWEPGPSRRADYRQVGNGPGLSRFSKT